MVRHLSVESLEVRRLFAADVTLNLSLARLEITDSDASSLIRVVRNGSDLVVHQFGGPSAKFASAGIKHIYYRGRGGNDTFVNETVVPALVYGNDGNDVLVGGSGQDELHGGPGNDVIDGSAGNDELHGDHGDDRLIGGQGNDDLRGWYGNDSLWGQEGDDVLSAYLGDDLLFGGSGNDELHGHEGDDVLLGDDGDDLLYGWLGDDALDGGDGDDYLSGWSGADVLVGGRGNDHLRGHAGDDLLIGGKESDRLDGGSGSDLMISGWTMIDDDPLALARLLAAWHEGSHDLKNVGNHKTFDDGQSDTLISGSLDADQLVYDPRKDQTSMV